MIRTDVLYLLPTKAQAVAKATAGEKQKTQQQTQLVVNKNGINKNKRQR